MHGHDIELDMLLRGIIMTRGDSGATIGEMRDDYYDIVAELWPLKHKTTQQIVRYLCEIDGLMLEKLDTGLHIWYIDDIGSTLSDRDSIDCNNNAISIGQSTFSSGNGRENAPRQWEESVLSNKNAPSSKQSIGAMLIDSVESENLKRQLSQESQNSHVHGKRQKLLTNEQLHLNEKNLDIHNRQNGANVIVNKKTTSTEIEHSIILPNEMNVCIVPNESIETINEPYNQLPCAFSKQCQINNNEKKGSEGSSTVLSEDELFPAEIGVIGDDFMRSLISYELFGGDFTRENDKSFGYCLSAMSVGDAYTLVLDKQNDLKAKYRYLILNVGSIDILMERDFFDIVAEYTRLVNAVELIGLQPIITTLPKVMTGPNYKNQKVVYQTLLLFNQVIKNLYQDKYLIIDLFDCLNKRKSNCTTQYYYQQPKRINKGRSELELFQWTESGRKKIISAIDWHIHHLE